jgi:hypothetical protein
LSEAGREYILVFEGLPAPLSLESIKYYDTYVFIQNLFFNIPNLTDHIITVLKNH